MNITEEQQDILNELLNIGIGDAAAILNDMVNCHVKLATPSINYVTKEVFKKSLVDKLGVDISMVEMKFSGGMNGAANLLFPLDSGKKLTNILSEDFDEEDYNTLKAGTLTEVGNIILNSVLASFSNALHNHLDYSVPEFLDIHMNKYVEKDLFKSGLESNVFLCEVNFEAEDADINGQVVLVFDVQTLNELFVTLEAS